MSEVKSYWTVTTSIENLNIKYILVNLQRKVTKLMAESKKDKRLVDLNDVNFRNKDVKKWIHPSQTPPVTRNKRNHGLKGLHTVTKIKRL